MPSARKTTSYIGQLLELPEEIAALALVFYEEGKV
jgi:hypothetical protein